MGDEKVTLRRTDPLQKTQELVDFRPNYGHLHFITFYETTEKKTSENIV